MTEPRPAATVVLLRDGANGIEAWLLRRVKQMAFAPGMTVFPGGRVDPDDAENIPWHGGDPAEVAARFGVDVSTARRTLVAAVRETFEETAVLLTSPPASLPADRAAVEAHELSFPSLLAAHDLAIDAATVRPWAHWITPPEENRRYDTYFFVAVVPSGAVAVDETSESLDASWVDVSAALDEYAAGSRPMLPPTVHTLREIARYARVADVLAASAGRDVAAIRPVLSAGADGGLLATLPDGQVLPLPGRTA